MRMSKPTRGQQKLARMLGLDITADSQGIALGKLGDFIFPLLYGSEPPTPATERQIEYGRLLGLDLEGATRRMASCAIGDELERRNFAAIRAMKLRAGDRVVRISRFRDADGIERTLEQEFVVSSIRDDGIVFFKGGNGQCAPAVKVRKAGGSYGGP